MGSARADVIVSTPTLPLLGVPYTISGGNCFPTAGFCVAGGAFTFTSLVGSSTSGGNEYFTTDTTFTGDVTTLSHTPVATVTLTGTAEQEVLARASPTDTGSWTVDLLSLSLSGTVAGYPLSLQLNPADLALDQGTTSITPVGNTEEFSVNSFFDVFADVTYGPLTATPSGVATASGVPEPATLMLLAGPLLAMSAMRRRRR